MKMHSRGSNWTLLAQAALARLTRFQQLTLVLYQRVPALSLAFLCAMPDLSYLDLDVRAIARVGPLIDVLTALHSLRPHAAASTSTMDGSAHPAQHSLRMTDTSNAHSPAYPASTATPSGLLSQGLRQCRECRSRCHSHTRAREALQVRRHGGATWLYVCTVRHGHAGWAGRWRTPAVPHPHERTHSHIRPWSTYDVVAGLRDAAAVVIQSTNNRIIQAAWSRAGARMTNQ